MPNEFMFQMLSMGGLFDTWGPLVNVLAILGIGLVFFLAPALGYTTYNRGLLLGSLWVLIGRLLLSLLQTGFLFMLSLDKGTSGGPLSSNDSQMVFILFSLLQSLIFILAMALFAGGLASLRRDLRREPDLGREPELRRAPPRLPND